ncbi:isopenicillin N synthase family dioxygenase [Pseudonocardia bannensis]|uniref:Isopenicillin N synthase family oxygenase n=1 Tax=Pseudonocardia bannensis TaxID=630973 RepID=A0A848DPZ4_9PSEU|nr:isopenicillin N synthase family oxygenase [Pseudonocardia bannensis]NMH94461.1 isopenicillin N synthase family oxygenase [Pseudonocardia bannensis]
MSSKSAIPLIDISPFRAGTGEGKAQVVSAVRAACEEIGFFLVSGHGVPEELINRNYRLAKEFFDLPLEKKNEVKKPGPQVSRGYSLLGGQNLAITVGNDAPSDLHETFTVGRPEVEPTPYYTEGFGPVHFAPNLWPSEPAGFKEAVVEYYGAMMGLTKVLMHIFACALDLEETYFDDLTDRGFSNLQYNNYPEPDRPPLPGQLRAAEHTDYGSVTILKVEDAPGGLQVKDRAGQWHDVGFVPDAFVVNLGDAMARWTNDRWKSTLHRVVNPPQDATLGSRRLSIPFFGQPNYDAMIECIPTCQSPDAPAKHEPVTAGAHWRHKAVLSRTAVK